MRQAVVLDVNSDINSSVPLWSETRWNGCWSPETGAGLYIHAGRFRKDLRFWWVHYAAYLPGGRLVVDRFWTRNLAGAGVRSELLDLEMTTTGWSSAHDGAGELTSSEALARAARGCSAPSVRVRWDVTATNLTPVWDMYSSVDTEQSFATSLHLQQASRTTGTLHVGDETYDLSGVGFYDHSSGGRSHTGWNGHRFLLGVMPGYSLHAIAVLGPDGTPGRVLGVVKAGDEQRPIEQFDAQGAETVRDEPRDQHIVVTGPDGRPLTLRVEIVHTLPHTVTPDNEHLNGIDLDLEGDPLVMFESVARLTDPSGVVGWGHFERSARRSALRPA